MWSLFDSVGIGFTMRFTDIDPRHSLPRNSLRTRDAALFPLVIEPQRLVVPWLLATFSCGRTLLNVEQRLFFSLVTRYARPGEICELKSTSSLVEKACRNPDNCFECITAELLSGSFLFNSSKLRKGVGNFTLDSRRGLSPAVFAIIDCMLSLARP